MALPGNYNASRVSVDPSQLNSCVDRLNQCCDSINAALADIMASLGDLRLSWTGDSQQLADDFNTRWEFAMGEMFGTQENPGTGILNTLTGGVAYAVENYANTEASIANMWNQFERALASPTNGTPADFTDTASGTPNPNYHTTSVNETGV
ncbi:WXG100 family type VII secretion target [Streptomyces sp. NPDC048527]|uniref:WXG100 family type VII secretion target n=1 Tax=Streptomyces sp. NPDC048527 TaxID=3365568 RepID=UPI0037156F41